MTKFWAACGLLFVAPSALAYVTTLPDSPAQDVLSETMPTAWSIAPYTAADYAVEWQGPPISGIDVSLGERSFEWVRVLDMLVLPRARLLVHAQGVEAGRVSNAGFSQGLQIQGADGAAELPVAMISGPKNPIAVEVTREGRVLHGTLILRFKPREEAGGPRVYLDPSCSHYRVRVELPPDAPESWPGDWAYVGCRFDFSEGAHHRTATLEAFVFWDGVGQTIAVDGAETPSTAVSIWPLRLRAEPGQVALRAGNQRFVLRYSIPEHLHYGSFGVGLGPYALGLRGTNGESTATAAAIPTLYGSYAITEMFHIVGFGAVSADPHLLTDVGAYLRTESVRFLDRRFVLSVLVGGHFTGFLSQGTYYFAAGAPQGTELVVIDAFRRGCDLTLGGFLYPLIEGTSYYNLYVRWGSPRLFAEVNGIMWQQTISGQSFSSTTLGLSVGMPLFGFL